MKEPRIEIVKSRSKKLLTIGATMGRLQYHVRIRAANGEILMASETYTRKRAADKCLSIIVDAACFGEIEVDETWDEK